MLKRFAITLVLALFACAYSFAQQENQSERDYELKLE